MYTYFNNRFTRLTNFIGNLAPSCFNSCDGVNQSTVYIQITISTCANMKTINKHKPISNKTASTYKIDWFNNQQIRYE